MSVTVVVLNGIGGCGKSTFAKFCTETNYKCRVYELSSIDFVKDVATMCGWDGSKTTKNRTFLHDLKMLLQEWDDVPNKKVFEQIADIEKLYDEDLIFFVNIREASEIKNFLNAAKEKGYNAYSVIVENSNSETTEPQDIIDDIYSTAYDYLIENEGTLDDLRLMAEDFIGDLVELD
jgi:broad-specificity NMP kinase